MVLIPTMSVRVEPLGFDEGLELRLDLLELDVDVVEAGPDVDDTGRPGRFGRRR